ncbi:MAG: NAD-dependent epimerase/dehydratase family protein [Chloroflexi bacterium]|nr:MAG: NAD-dependent epimerase/dehydratase family protein [Chloroflexota bacterium]
MHLVIGAGEFLGDHVSRALAREAPVIELNADADDETLADAIKSVEVVHYCAESWSPARRLRVRRDPPRLLQRVVEASRSAGVRRIVHVSTADVYGPDHVGKITEKARLKPTHAYERLKLLEESWLLEAAQDLEVVVLRPARMFGLGEEWMLPRLMRSLARGRVWLPGGGAVRQTFIAAEDVGRACLAAADRGKPGKSYLIGGFDATWRDLLESCARAAGIGAHIVSLPYDIAYLRALAVETLAAQGAPVWPGIYAVDVIGKPHLLDDSHSRRELTWSPSVGSFEQAMPQMAGWLSDLTGVEPVGRAEGLFDG